MRVDPYTFVAKVVFLVTGVWWGICMQLLVYAGVARRPLAGLPNFDWYLSMCLCVVPGRFLACRGAPGPACELRAGCPAPPARRLPPWRLLLDRDVALASLCDWGGTVTTVYGLTLAGSAIFGIV